jgi:uncharacterized protein (DUF1810 family)
MAQDGAVGGFASALAELEAGAKRGHWIWYVFPQLAGLGHSHMSRTFALRDPGEAIAYARDSELRARLLAISAVVAARLREGIALTTLMGGQIDALKLVSSLTLFEWAGNKLLAGDGESQGDLAKVATEILSAAEVQGYPRCQHTLRELRAFDARGAG